MECIVVGNGDKTAWIIHRQHPGEKFQNAPTITLLTVLISRSY